MSGNSTFGALPHAFWRLSISSAAKTTIVAITLCIVGWSLLWAQALSIVELVPQWVCTLLFFTGIALIPFCRMPMDEKSAAR
jgi:hypothetical protein